ncbi:MAG TPA: dsRBD fold-containing protein, partial [Mycobacterium sp.]
DEPLAQIGDELAIARALSHLANQLFALTSTDIQASTHELVTHLHH